MKKSVSDVLGGGVEVGVGEGARGRGGRESAILKALAKGSSLQEAVGDTKRRGGSGGGRSISVGGDLSSLASLAEARGGEAAQSTVLSAAESEPLAAVVAVVAPALGSQAAASASTTPAPAPNGAAAAVTVAAAAATVAGGGGGGAKLGRTSSIGKSSSSSQLPQVPEALGGAAAAGAAGTFTAAARAADSGSFGNLQLGATRILSAPPPVGGGGKGHAVTGVAGATSGGGGGGGLGGLVPRKDRLLSILGQNKFTPRKDYPPSSMLFQVLCVFWSPSRLFLDLGFSIILPARLVLLHCC